MEEAEAVEGAVVGRGFRAHPGARPCPGPSASFPTARINDATPRLQRRDPVG